MKLLYCMTAHESVITVVNHMKHFHYKLYITSFTALVYSHSMSCLNS